jgi:hypothetical protein
MRGRVEIVSDCLGALNRVTYLPPYRIPSCCRHSNILKNILVHCRYLSFTTYYLHIRAHQDDNESFDKLDQKAQLHCICDHAAKQRIVTDGTDGTTQGRLFPLEPIGVFVRGEKMTSETGERIRFWAHHQRLKNFTMKGSCYPMNNLTMWTGCLFIALYMIYRDYSKYGWPSTTLA